ncbi:hypothetical protein BDV10DRAFT_192563 [Aspergillus recurvatus]
MSLAAPGISTRHTYARRFGRTYHGLDNLATASLCSRDVGKVRADCRLRVSKSQWGSLGAGSPAAIVYMDIVIDQPHDCLLANATVLITLDDVSATGSTVPGGHALQMTDYYGPKHLSGEATKVVVTKTVHLTPQVNVLGSGGGGVGIEREKATSYSSRWTFTGGLLPGATKSAVYRTLKWELRENEEGGRPNRSNVIHTAFTLQHNDRPFLLRIEIQGRLKSTRHRFRQTMRHWRFPNPHAPEQGKSETLVYPNTKAGQCRSLDMLAMSLSSAMERENYMRIPVEMPEALPVSFSMESEAAIAPQLTPSPLAQPSLDTSTHMSETPQRKKVSFDLVNRGIIGSDSTPIEPTKTTPSSVLNVSSSSTMVDPSCDRTSRNSLDLWSTILERAVESFHDTRNEDSGWRQPSPPRSPLVVPQTEEEKNENPDALSVISKYPVLLLLMQVLAGVLDLVFTQREARRDVSDGKVTNGHRRIMTSPFPGQWPDDEK